MSIFKVADEVKVDLFRQSMPQIMDALGQCTPDGDLSADDVIDFFAVCLASLLDNDTNLRTPRDIRLGVEVIGKHIERHTKAFRTVNAGRTVSWQMSMPRSNSRSSTFRSDNGKRAYIITTRRMTSGDELKYRNGLADLFGRGISAP